jgi:hypothetical protein
MIKIRFIKSILSESLVLIASSTMIVSYPAHSAPPPTQIGQCANTFIQRIGTRFIDSSTGTSTTGNGTSALLTNGVYLVSYDQVKQLQVARVGDQVKLCLLHIPENCPRSDNRGKIYSLLNYRTGGSVNLPDSQHMCGGA